MEKKIQGRMLNFFRATPNGFLLTFLPIKKVRRGEMNSTEYLKEENPSSKPDAGFPAEAKTIQAMAKKHKRFELRNPLQ